MPRLDRNANNDLRQRRNAQRLRDEPNSILDLGSKGSLLTSDGSSVTALPVGADGRMLEARSSVSTGLRWVEQIISETPAGLINGTNPTFTLAYTPLTGSLEVYVNGVLQTAGVSNDYTLSTATITFNAGSIPETADLVRASYRRA